MDTRRKRKYNLSLSNRCRNIVIIHTSLRVAKRNCLNPFLIMELLHSCHLIQKILYCNKHFPVPNTSSYYLFSYALLWDYYHSLIISSLTQNMGGNQPADPSHYPWISWQRFPRIPLSPITLKDKRTRYCLCCHPNCQLKSIFVLGRQFPTATEDLLLWD